MPRVTDPIPCPECGSSTKTYRSRAQERARNSEAVLWQSIRTRRCTGLGCNEIVVTRVTERLVGHGPDPTELVKELTHG